jgi:hypothetical protein
VQRDAHLGVSHVAAWAGNLSGGTIPAHPARQPATTNGPEGPLSAKGKLGVADGARTHDNRNHNPGLYQLSYSHRRPRL